MRPRSSSSVKVFYPPWTREALLVRLREGVIALREVLPLIRVVLFGSYARGRQTVPATSMCWWSMPERCAVMPMGSSGACSTSGAWNLMCTQKRNMHR